MKKLRMDANEEQDNGRMATTTKLIGKNDKRTNAEMLKICASQATKKKTHTKQKPKNEDETKCVLVHDVH